VDNFVDSVEYLLHNDHGIHLSGAKSPDFLREENQKRRNYSPHYGILTGSADIPPNYPHFIHRINR
jgi:hypothetical protein